METPKEAASQVTARSNYTVHLSIQVLRDFSSTQQNPKTNIAYH